jgi:hypothetical protein
MKYIAIIATLLATTSCACRTEQRNVIIETRSKEVYEMDAEGKQIKNTIITGEIRY